MPSVIRVMHTVCIDARHAVFLKSPRTTLAVFIRESLPLFRTAELCAASCEIDGLEHMVNLLRDIRSFIDVVDTLVPNQKDYRLRALFETLLMPDCTLDRGHRLPSVIISDTAPLTQITVAQGAHASAEYRIAYHALTVLWSEVLYEVENEIPYDDIYRLLDEIDYCFHLMEHFDQGVDDIASVARPDFQVQYTAHLEGIEVRLPDLQVDWSEMYEA